MRAFCFASGHIEFGPTVPDGALPLARGRAKKLKDFIEPMARHGYSTRLVAGRLTKIPGTETLLVPGIPEAPNQDAALDALHRWLDWIGQNPPAGIKVHVPPGLERVREDLRNAPVEGEAKIDPAWLSLGAAR